MLSGPELGRAIEAARKLKGVQKKDIAAHFGVKPPSVQAWVQRGTVSKSRLSELFAYFADVVGPEHWGMRPEELGVQTPPAQPTTPVIASEPAAAGYAETARRENFLQQLVAIVQSLPSNEWASIRVQLDGLAEGRYEADAVLTGLRKLVGAQQWDGITNRRTGQDRRSPPPSSETAAA